MYTLLKYLCDKSDKRNCRREYISNSKFLDLQRLVKEHVSVREEIYLINHICIYNQPKLPVIRYNQIFTGMNIVRRKFIDRNNVIHIFIYRAVFLCHMISGYIPERITGFYNDLLIISVSDLRILR